MRIIVLFGLVSLLADLTYEGARGIVGPYLSLLGASAFAVGLIAGLGEFLGYSLRLVFGYIADRTRAYWLLTIGGYALNLFSVPLLALATSWQWAGLLVLLERLGKSIRTPSRDVLLSFATKRLGHGKGFGIHEFLDQIGALLGPVLVSLLLLITESYRIAFLSLGIPAFLALLVLFYARLSYREEVSQEVREGDEPLRSPFLLYLLSCLFIAFGYADFALIAYHMKRTLVIPESYIPLSYALAMATDALSALIFGLLFDRIGFHALSLGVLLALPFPVLAFSEGFYSVLLGVILWGAGMGVQESIMRSAVAKLTPERVRGRAYGTFHFTFGLSWFLGSALMGYLYEISLNHLILLSLISQALSLPLLFILSSRSLR